MTSKHTPIPGFPGYVAARNGTIFSIAHNWRGYGARQLIADRNFDGYASVRLTIDGKRTRIAVHKLIARTFLPRRPDCPDAQIRHLDGDRMNPNADNLAWGSAADNAADRERHGRTSRGPSHSIAIKNGLQSRGASI